jgi:hypothetical protein
LLWDEPAAFEGKRRAQSCLLGVFKRILQNECRFERAFFSREWPGSPEFLAVMSGTTAKFEQSRTMGAAAGMAAIRCLAI